VGERLSSDDEAWSSPCCRGRNICELAVLLEGSSLSGGVGGRSLSYAGNKIGVLGALRLRQDGNEKNCVAVTMGVGGDRSCLTFDGRLSIQQVLRTK